MKPMRRTTIGKRTAMIREHRMMSQAALAAAIGVTKSVINHIEQGHTRISIERLEQLIGALHCSDHDLLAPLDAPLPRIKFHGHWRQGAAKNAVGFQAAA
jgi:transcriptional regulator with XRE-family HTH domain